MPMFERSIAFYVPANAGPVAVSQVLAVPDGGLNSGHLALEAWTGAQAGPNVIILEGAMSTAEATQRISATDAAHALDCLMVVPRGAVGRVRIPLDSARRITAFLDAVNAAPVVVNLRFTETS